jgi:hypothetical protein
MALDFSVFQQLRSPHDSIVQQASTFIVNALNDPEFIYYLFDGLQSQTDPFIRTQILILIVNIIRQRWLEETPFLSPTGRSFISTALWQLVVSLPLEDRNHILAAFRYIIQRTFPDCLIMHQILDLYRIHSESIPNIATFLRLTNYRTDSCGQKLKVKKNVLDIGNEVMQEIGQINIELVDRFIVILSQGIEAIGSSRDAEVIVGLIAGSLYRLLITLE